MPRQIVTKARFERAYHQLSAADQERVDEALKRFQRYLQTNEAPFGLELKHLGGRTYEFRAGLALRIVYVAEGEEVALSLLGTHDEDRRFLKCQRLR